MIIGCADGTAHLIHSSTGALVRTITDHRGAPITLIDVALHRNNDFTWLMASMDRRVSLWSDSDKKSVLKDCISFAGVTTPKGKHNSRRRNPNPNT